MLSAITMNNGSTDSANKHAEQQTVVSALAGSGTSRTRTCAPLSLAICCLHSWCAAFVFFVCCFFCCCGYFLKFCSFLPPSVVRLFFFFFFANNGCFCDDVRIPHTTFCSEVCSGGDVFCFFAAGYTFLAFVLSCHHRSFADVDRRQIYFFNWACFYDVTKARTKHFFQ